MAERSAHVGPASVRIPQTYAYIFKSSGLFKPVAEVISWIKAIDVHRLQPLDSTVKDGAEWLVRVNVRVRSRSLWKFGVNL